MPAGVKLQTEGVKRQSDILVLVYVSLRKCSDAYDILALDV